MLKSAKTPVFFLRSDVVVTSAIYYYRSVLHVDVCIWTRRTFGERIPLSIVQSYGVWTNGLTRAQYEPAAAVTTFRDNEKSFSSPKLTCTIISQLRQDEHMAGPRFSCTDRSRRVTKIAEILLCTSTTVKPMSVHSKITY